MLVPKIPEALHDTLFAMYGDLDPATSRRRTYRDLAAWLESAHGIKVSHMAVRSVVDPLRRQRDELRRDVIRERLVAQLGPQLDDLDELMVKVKALTLNGPKGKKASASVVLDALDGYRKAVETKLKFAGVGERTELGGEVDVTSDGAALRIYLPRETPVDDDDGGPPETE